MANGTLQVFAFWDDEAKVWVAESDDVPGLITEADSVDTLIAKLGVMIPELLEENRKWDDAPAVPWEIVVRDPSFMATR